MINKNIFEVALEEKLRILNLHENATKKQYLIFEDFPTTGDPVPKTVQIKNPDGTTSTITTDETKQIIPFNFKAGFWSAEKTDLSAQVKQKLQYIKDFLAKHQGTNITVTIEAGESKVPNRDNENIDPNTKRGKKVGEKYLATHRADSLKNLLQNSFQELYQNKAISVMPTFTDPKIVVGKEVTPGPEADKEQYVRAVISAGYSDKKTDCLVNLKITADYKKYSEVSYQDHSCKRAIFKLYGNNVYLGIINLNNYTGLETGQKEGGGSGINAWRVSEVVINQATANAILAKNPNQIELKLVCNFEGADDMGKRGCHSDPIHLKITDSKGVDLMPPKFLSAGNGLQFGQSAVIAILDSCGKPIEQTTK